MSTSNPNSGGSQQAQTASNVLSGEKSYRRIEFAITGDPMADFIAGIRALQASHYPNIPSITVSHLLRALSDIAKAQHEWETEGRRIEADRARQYQQLASLGGGWPPTPKDVSDYTTSACPPAPLFSSSLEYDEFRKKYDQAVSHKPSSHSQNAKAALPLPAIVQPH